MTNICLRVYFVYIPLRVGTNMLFSIPDLQTSDGWRWGPVFTVVYCSCKSACRDVLDATRQIGGLLLPWTAEQLWLVQAQPQPLNSSGTQWTFPWILICHWSPGTQSSVAQSSEIWAPKILSPSTLVLKGSFQHSGPQRLNPRTLVHCGCLWFLHTQCVVLYSSGPCIARPCFPSQSQR